jgi:hypothetical protein
MIASGNGQHRRPRQAPKFVVSVGATGAGIALPLLASGAAHAASAGTWDKVAKCESGGVWSADTGDGFYGGLNLTRGIWASYGGTAYADSPEFASRQEQIAVAQRILDAQGPGYWAQCGAAAGLAQGGPAPDVDPGTPQDDHGLVGGLLGSVLPPSPSASAPAGSPAPSASSTPSTGASGSASPAPSASSPSGVPSAPAASVSASASAPSADASLPPAATPPASSGRHAKPAAPALSPEEGADAAAQPGAYTVRPGDNLYEIAARHAVPGGWSALYAANRSVVGDDPGLIRPGEDLTLG